MSKVKKFKKFKCEQCSYASDRGFNLKRHVRSKHKPIDERKLNPNITPDQPRKKSNTQRRVKKVIQLQAIEESTEESEDEPLVEEVKELVEEAEIEQLKERNVNAHPIKEVVKEEITIDYPPAPKVPKRNKEGPVKAPRRLNINRTTTRNIGLGMIGAGVFAGMM